MIFVAYAVWLIMIVHHLSGIVLVKNICGSNVSPVAQLSYCNVACQGEGQFRQQENSPFMKLLCWKQEK